MRLIVPYVGELEGSDARLIALAEFLGARCETLSLVPDVRPTPECLERVAAGRHPAALLVNPRVWERWLAGSFIPEGLFPALLSGIFSHVLLHSPRVENSFDANFISKLSQGQLGGVQQRLARPASVYEIETSSQDFCEAFSGQSFGPVNHSNDYVFITGSVDRGIRHLISIGRTPFFAVTKCTSTEIMFLGSADVVDLNSQIDATSMSSYFSRFLPHAMALRHIFGHESWHPTGQYGCVIIDDPFLRERYGFLKFDSLLDQMHKSNFHTSVAFIPYNHRRNSPDTVRMFLDNSSRLSLCFHGNDHTEAEMASLDPVRLSSMLRIAELRMNKHCENTGLACDKVMVFPQGAFSCQAINMLKARNFLAAVNTSPYPKEGAAPLTIREYAQPAVTRYNGFSLFLRTYVKAVRSEDMAFNLFFGRPALIVEHHSIFENPEDLNEAVSKVNSLSARIQWSSLQSVVSSAVLKRCEADGTYTLRAYSGTVRLSNDSDRIERLQILWPGTPKESVEQITANGNSALQFDADGSGIRVSMELPPSSSRCVSLIHQSDDCGLENLGLRWNAKAFVRRRLSEIRDNHLSKHRRLLLLVQGMRHGIQARRANAKADI